MTDYRSASALPALIRQRVEAFRVERDSAPVLDPRADAEAEALLSTLDVETDPHWIGNVIEVCAWLYWCQYEAEALSGEPEARRRRLWVALSLLQPLAAARPHALPQELSGIAAGIFAGPHGWAQFGLAVMQGRALPEEYRPPPRQVAADLVYCAVASLPPDDPDRAGMLGDLATAYRQAYEHRRDVEDLLEAAMLAQTCVELTPQDAEDLPSRLSDLSGCLTMLASVQGNADRAGAAVRIGEHAVAGIRPGDEDRGRVLSNCARAYAIARKWYGDSMMGRAVVLGAEAVTATAPTDPYLPGRLHTLGLHASVHYMAFREEAPDSVRFSADTAVNALRDFLDLTPPGTKVHADAAETLRTSLRLRYEDWGELQDLADSLRM